MKGYPHPDFTVTFAPAASTGSATGSISVVSTATNSPATVSLSGIGVGTASPLRDSDLESTSAVAGYNAYRGNLSGGPYTRLNSSLVASTTYTDYTVQAGQTYFYVAIAVNANNVESVYSNQAQATVLSSSQLTATPNSINFGNVTVGGSNTQTVTLSNSGSANLTISQASVTGVGCSISGLPLPLTLAGQTTLSAPLAA